MAIIVVDRKLQSTTCSQYFCAEYVDHGANYIMIFLKVIMHSGVTTTKYTAKCVYSKRRIAVSSIIRFYKYRTTNIDCERCFGRAQLHND